MYKDLTKTSNADGSGLVKPVMPTPPDSSSLEALKKSLLQMETLYVSLRGNHTHYMQAKAYDKAASTQREMEVLASNIDGTKSQIAGLQAQYDADYAAYEKKLNTYNTSFAAWAAAQAALNKTDATVLKAQIESEKAKADAALKAASEAASISSKKWIIIGLIVAALAIIGGTIYYFVKVKQ
jgi:hypothetical protein